MGIAGEYNYSECASCGAVYQAPLPTIEEIATFYPEEYKPYKPGRAKETNPLEKAVLHSRYSYTHIQDGLPGWLGWLAGFVLYRDSTPFIQDGSLLDIGCGGGKFLNSMQNIGWTVEGVEFNPSAVQTCRDAGLKVFQGELSDAAFPDNTFDIVTARHVIEHISTPGPFVAEIFRILKPGGKMILRTPNSRALGRNWFGTNWFANDVPRHLILFSPGNLRLLAEELGFQPLKNKTFSSPKIILNSWDYLTNHTGKPSKKRKLRRMLARIYVAGAALLGRGDEIFSIFKKPTNP